MDKARVLFACAVALYCLSLVEVSPGFSTVSAGRSLRGGATAYNAGQSSQTSSLFATRSGLQTASMLLTLSACAMSSRDAKTAAARSARTQMRGSSSPIVVYMSALSQAANQKAQAIEVTKDVMQVKSLMNNQDFMEKVGMVLNEPGLNQMDHATSMLDLIGDLQSDVFPKFVTYLAKKKRLLSLKPICEEYVKSLYETNNVVPVVVTSAQPMTDAQMSALTEKMQITTGATDIKLVCKVDADVLGGIIVEWDFIDPQLLATPSQRVDLTLKAVLARKAIMQGVTPTL